MEVNYKLDKVRELAGGDDDFVMAIAAAFLEEVPEAIEQIEAGVAAGDFKQVYQNAHKIKPTIQMFEVPVFDALLKVQDWGKFEQKEIDIKPTFLTLKSKVALVSEELKSDFGL